MDETQLSADSGRATGAEKPWLRLGPGQLPYRVLLLAKMIERVTAQHVRAIADLSVPEWRALTHCHVLGRSRAKEVADAAFADRAEVSRAIASLEARGLVEREPNPAHRKSSLISLTEEGQFVHAYVRSERSKIFEEWLADLNPAERAAMDAALGKIMQRVADSAPDLFEG